MRLNTILLLLALGSSLPASAATHFYQERHYLNPDEAVRIALSQYPGARPVGIDDRGSFYEVRLIWNGQLIIAKVNKQ